MLLPPMLRLVDRNIGNREGRKPSDRNLNKKSIVSSIGDEGENDEALIIEARDRYIMTLKVILLYSSKPLIFPYFSGHLLPTL